MKQSISSRTTAAAPRGGTHESQVVFNCSHPVVERRGTGGVLANGGHGCNPRQGEAEGNARVDVEGRQSTGSRHLCEVAARQRWQKLLPARGRQAVRSVR